MIDERIRTYSELCRLETFVDRYRYLRLSGEVCKETFGFERYLNQVFYHSREWKMLRDKVIVRDMGCDLGLDGYEIHGQIYVHHMNPVLIKDVREVSDLLVNPEYLVCTTLRTHNAIHYGDETLLDTGITERRPNDTCPWRTV
nr:MAG TPA: HNH endonuclease bacteriophage, HNH Endonuclease, DNA.52A [Caudoviricetes sp.]